MDLNICTVSPGAHDVTIEVRCRAQPLPHNPIVQTPTVTLNDLEVASFIFGSHVGGHGEDHSRSFQVIFTLFAVLVATRVFAF